MEAETKKKVLRKLTYGMWVNTAAAGDDVRNFHLWGAMRGALGLAPI